MNKNTDATSDKHPKRQARFIRDGLDIFEHTTEHPENWVAEAYSCDLAERITYLLNTYGDTEQ